MHTTVHTQVSFGKDIILHDTVDDWNPAPIDSLCHNLQGFIHPFPGDRRISEPSTVLDFLDRQAEIVPSNLVVVGDLRCKKKPSRNQPKITKIKNWKIATSGWKCETLNFRILLEGSFFICLFEYVFWMRFFLTNTRSARSCLVSGQDFSSICSNAIRKIHPWNSPQRSECFFWRCSLRSWLNGWRTHFQTANMVPADFEYPHVRFLGDQLPLFPEGMVIRMSSTP